MIGKSCAGIIACLASLAVPSLAQDGGRQWDRQSLSKWLSYQEGLVKTATAVFDVAYTVTPKDAVPLLKEACRLRGNEPDYQSYVISQAFVDKNSNRFRWWRQGEQERVETFAYGDSRAMSPAAVSPDTRVFDGNIVRGLYAGDAGRIGTLDTVESGHWHSENRENPFTLVYEWFGTPMSRLVKEAAECDIVAILRDGKRCTQVTIRRNKDEWIKGKFVFDENDRLVEREETGKLPGDPSDRPFVKVELSDYREMSDASGEKIVFPHKAVYHRYAGLLGNGTPVEYTKQSLEIRSIGFNVDIPRETFVLRFPPGTRIWDDITGAGWLDSPDALNSLIEGHMAGIHELPPSTLPASNACLASERVTPASPVPLTSGGVGGVAQSRGGADNWMTVTWIAIGIAAVSAICMALLAMRRRSLRGKRGNP